MDLVLKLIVCLMQALEVIRELQKHYPIKRSPMRIRLTLPGQNSSSLLEKLNVWNASIVSKDESGSQLSIVSNFHFYEVHCVANGDSFYLINFTSHVNCYSNLLEARCLFNF